MKIGRQKIIYAVSVASSLLSSFFIFLFPVSTAFEFIKNDSIWLSNANAFAGDEVKIYTVVVNNDFPFVSSDIQFFNNGSLIGTAVIDNLSFESAEQVWIAHTLLKGENVFTIRLANFVAKNADGSVVPLSDANTTGYEVSKTFTIDLDTDHDDVGDAEDLDDDNDGLSDEEEAGFGTNPLLADTDGDGVGDKEEIQKGLDPNKKDSDGDGYLDGADDFPQDSGEWEDTDNDGIGNNADPDDDNDGLSDQEEGDIGSNPLILDTDGDGLPDGKEKEYGSDPTKVDTDQDGISDNDEVSQGLNPGKNDTDGDGITDQDETKKGTNPSVSDSDGDSLSDGRYRSRWVSR